MLFYHRLSIKLDTETIPVVLFISHSIAPKNSERMAAISECLVKYCESHVSFVTSLLVVGSDVVVVV